MTSERKVEIEKWLSNPMKRDEVSNIMGKELLASLNTLETRIAEVTARLPDCPPCDMGENTECICKAELVPKPWMDEVIKERDTATSLLASKDEQIGRLTEANKVIQSYGRPHDIEADPDSPISVPILWNFIDQWKVYASTIESERDKLQAENAELRNALELYGYHNYACGDIAGMEPLALVA